MIETLSKWWCKNFHHGTFWPIRGAYRCSVCLRTYTVPWEEPQAAATEPAAVVAWTPAQQHLAR